MNTRKMLECLRTPTAVIEHRRDGEIWRTAPVQFEGIERQSVEEGGTMEYALFSAPDDGTPYDLRLNSITLVWPIIPEGTTCLPN